MSIKNICYFLIYLVGFYLFLLISVYFSKSNIYFIIISIIKNRIKQKYLENFFNRLMNYKNIIMNFSTTFILDMHLDG